MNFLVILKVILISLISLAECGALRTKKMDFYVSQCRRGCVSKFLQQPIDASSYLSECIDRPNCFMCWDYCSMLYKDRKKKIIVALMCSDGVCFDGCKFACNYYQYVLNINRNIPATLFNSQSNSGISSST